MKKENEKKEKYPGMPIKEQEFREGIDSYLEKHPGKEGINYQIPKMTEKEKKKQDILYVIQTFIPVIILAILIYAVFKIGTVPSSSMDPTLKKGDFIIANRLAYTFNEPQRGEIVIFKKNGSYLVKRIIGLPGETVELKDGNVYVDDVLINESYLTPGTFTLPFTDGNAQYIFEVPDKSVLLFGDNRTASADARVWKDKNDNPSPFVTYRNIVGKVILSVSKENGIVAHKGYQYVSGQIDSYEIETSDQITATIDPNSVPTEPDIIIVETLPVDTDAELIESASETLPAERETEIKETLPIDGLEEPEKEGEASTETEEESDE